MSKIEIGNKTYEITFLPGTAEKLLTYGSTEQNIVDAIAEAGEKFVDSDDEFILIDCTACVTGTIKENEIYIERVMSADNVF